jgi:transposase InsO family protein
VAGRRLLRPAQARAAEPRLVYDFVEDRTHDGRKFRLLNVIDEFTHECLAIRVGRKLKAADVIDVLSDLFILRGVPAHIRSDNVLDREGAGRFRQQVSIASLH